MKRYPFIEFMAARGRKAALVVGVLLALAAIASVFLGASPPLTACLLAGAAVAYVAVRLAAELVEVIADTLMPR